MTGAWAGAGAGAWAVERARASAHALHESWPAPSARAGRFVRLCAVEGTPAVVLGSAQGDDVLDAGAVARAGLEVVRRGAGGGAVLLGPGAQVWADLWLPRRDPLWVDDVVSSSWWVGEAWARALEGLGVTGPAVHRAKSEPAPWSGAVCFAGLGPGEVTVEGRKVVGLSQRRTRHGARWYTMACLVWDPAPLVGLLQAPAHADRGAPPGGAPRGHDASVLDDAAVGLRAVVPGTAALSDEDVIALVEDALVGALAS